MPPVDAALEGWLPADPPPESGVPATLAAAMRHLVFPGGKRLRPALALTAAEAVGGAREHALPVAVAVECIHIYSLVHDDLPCMDDDDLRRGRPTVHVAFGESTAVLAGDALQALAFEALASAESDPQRVALAVRDLARAAGPGGLVGGQVDDLAVESDSVGVEAKSPDRERIEGVHLRKSAALIRAAILGGARLGGADDARLEALGHFGSEVGLAFQVADDLLDADEDGACSLVRVLGLEGARARAKELMTTALGRVEDLGPKAEPLRTLARFAVERDH